MRHPDGIFEALGRRDMNARTVSLVFVVMAASAEAAPYSAQAFLCGGGAAEKDLVTLGKAQVFDLTDVTIANSSAQTRFVGIAIGTWPSGTTGSSRFAAIVPPGSTFKQQFKTPITFSGGSPVKARNVCTTDNLGVAVTVSGDLR
jgi:hypothetical protein